MIGNFRRTSCYLDYYHIKMNNKTKDTDFTWKNGILLYTLNTIEVHTLQSGAFHLPARAEYNQTSIKRLLSRSLLQLPVEPPVGQRLALTHRPVSRVTHQHSVPLINTFPSSSSILISYITCTTNENRDFPHSYTPFQGFNVFQVVHIFLEAFGRILG